MFRFIVLATIVATVYALQPLESEPQWRAVCHLQANENNVVGNVTFTQQTRGYPVQILGTLYGLKPGLHGFHIHEKGDLSGGCATAAGHFNPDKKNHGAPTAGERHAGDFGNIEAGADGVAHINFTDAYITLCGRYSVLGRAVVVHADPDDLGLGNKEDSLTTGHAGGRLACGIIAVL